MKDWNIAALESVAEQGNVDRVMRSTDSDNVHIISFIDNTSRAGVSKKRRGGSIGMNWLWQGTARLLRERESWLTTIWLSSEDNHICDALSRGGDLDTITEIIRKSHNPLKEWVPHANYPSLCPHTVAIGYPLREHHIGN